MSEILQDKTVDDLYLHYLDKFSKGEYIIPPLLIIDEIVRNRYAEELLDVKDIGISLISKIEDFKDRNIFDKLIEGAALKERMVEKKSLLCDYLNEYLTGKEITVKYPEITITNSYGKTHTITDLFIKTKFNHLGQLREGFTMSRSTYTYTELLVGYRHSHHRTISVNESSLKSWNTTCLGQGVLSQSTNLLRGLTLEEFDEINIMSLYADIDAYVAWESIEGTPYIRMERIRGMSSSANPTASFSPLTTLSSYDKQLLKEVMKADFIIKNCKLIPSIKDNHPYYNLEYDEYKMMKYLNSKVEDLKLKETYQSKKRVCYISVDDFGNVSYYKIDDNTMKLSEMKRLNGTRLFDFKGQPVNFKAIDNLNSKENTREISINPDILYYIITNIETEINTLNGRNRFNQSSL